MPDSKHLDELRSAVKVVLANWKARSLPPDQRFNDPLVIRTARPDEAISVAMRYMAQTMSRGEKEEEST
jgi:hypothetical protein